MVPGITAVGTPGHSPGHTSLLVSSGSGKVYVQGDVTHVPYLFARNPGWHAFYDQDAAVAEATRRKVYDMLVAEKMMVQGFHYPFPAHAYIEKTGDRLSRDHGAVECRDLIVAVDLSNSRKRPPPGGLFCASRRPFVTNLNRM